MSDITVQYSVSKEEESLSGYPLEVEVVGKTGISDAVFVLQHVEGDGTDDIFIQVADPNGMEEFPESIAELTDENQYYRVNSCELFFRTWEELVDTKSLIAQSIQRLMDSVNSRNNTELVEEVTYG